MLKMMKQPLNLSMTIPASREVHYALINIGERVVATFMINEYGHGLVLNWVFTLCSPELFAPSNRDKTRMYIE